MKRRERDFVALFNALWYRDFPVTPNHEDLGRRAVWTTHIASIVKQCSDLMGLFTCFESGGRTDAVVQTAERDTWAKIEWEWTQPLSEKVNEFEKLAAAATSSELLVYIGYSRSDRHRENLKKIHVSWKKINTPLLAFLVTYSYHGKRRHFELLQTHYYKGGGGRMVRRQPALPWQVSGTKWAVLANPAVHADAAG
jgi:hypothetical protein